MVKNLKISDPIYNPRYSSELDMRFMQVTESIASLCANEGTQVKPYKQGLPLFSKLPIERKKEVIRDVEFYEILCLEQVADGCKIKDNLSFTWRALNRLGLVPRSDLFQYMRDDHIVEIYSDQNVQLFRNFNFFDVCSYTLEELHTMEWWSLFDRDPHITKTLFKYASDIFSGVITNNFVPDLLGHQVNEASSSDKLIMEYRMDMMGPLFVQKEPRALISLERAQLIKT